MIDIHLRQYIHGQHQYNFMILYITQVIKCIFHHVPAVGIGQKAPIGAQVVTCHLESTSILAAYPSNCAQPYLTTTMYMSNIATVALGERRIRIATTIENEEILIADTSGMKETTDAATKNIGTMDAIDGSQTRPLVGFVATIV
nr:hypothetical protein [uncultured Undibacterium sp.]